MKKTVVNSVAFAFVSMMLFFTSCKTKEPQACKVEPSKITTTKINSLDYHFNIYDFRTGKERNSDAEYSLAITSDKIPAAEFDKIQILKDVFNSEINSRSILTAIFISAKEDNGSQLLERNVGAIAIWYKTSEKLKLAVYKRTSANEKLILDGEAYEAKGVRMEDFYKINRKVKLANTMLVGHNTVYVVTSDNYNKTEYNKLKKNTNNRFDIYYYVYNNTPVLLKEKDLLIMSSFPSPEKTTLTCGGFCATPQLRGNCVYEPGGGAPICDEPIDPDQCEKNEGIDQQTPIAAGEEIDNTLHNLRDNILAKSEFGQHTIASYYYCSTELHGKVNLSLAIKTANLIVNVIYPAAQKLNNPRAISDNTIFMTNKDIDDLVDLCKDIQALSSDETFLPLMDENITNLEFCKGKTTSEIYSALK